jgi:glyoxylase-like metal-dependent hydrolase (beta-lactamase superfamily II)
MNRRDFLVRTSFVTAAGLVARAATFAQPGKAGQPPATPEFTPLRRGTGYFTMTGGTIGWLVNRDALAAVDTQFPPNAKAFLAGLPGRGGRKLDVVVNTHHHGDHTGGNAVFKPEAKKIVGHVNVPELQRARAAADKKGDAPTPPDTTFADTWHQALGDETVRARYFGAAHTRGDIVTHLEKANVVHLGDLVFNRLYPVIDRPGGGTIRGWVERLETIAREYPADAIYLCGHGSAKFGVKLQRGDLLVFRDYLSGVLDYVQKKIAAGESKEKIIALDNLPGFPDYHVPPTPQNRLPGNLSVAYDELTGKA